MAKNLCKFISSVVSIVFLGMAIASSTMASPVGGVADPGGWFTDRNVHGTGAPGDTITITYPPGVSPGSQSTVVGVSGRWVILVPPTVPPGTVGVITSDAVPAQTPTSIPVSSLLNPPSNIATATHTVTGGAATVAGNNFNLSGGYTLTATSVDYNPASPTYGNLSGQLLASGFNLVGTGPSGTATFTLNAGQNYTVSMLPYWTSGSPVSFNIPLSGLVQYNALSSLFTGSVTGTSTYGENASETYTYNINLNSDFGPITGSGTSTGLATLTPEPGAVTLLTGCSFVCLVGVRRRYCRRRLLARR